MDLAWLTSGYLSGRLSHAIWVHGLTPPPKLKGDGTVMKSVTPKISRRLDGKALSENAKARL